MPIGDLCDSDAPLDDARAKVPGAHLSAEQYIKEMERLVAVAGPGQRERRFFFWLDRQTNPQLEGQAFAKLPRQSMVKISFEHRALRSVGKGNADLPESVEYEDADARAFLTGMFRIFEPLLADLGDGVDDAMDHFANGSLRLRLTSGEWTTQPSSGFFFLSGEAGLLGVQFRDPALWLPYARAAIRAQEVFAAVFARTEEREDPYDRFSGCSFRADRQWTLAKRDALRAKYAHMSLRELQMQAAENARRLLFR